MLHCARKYTLYSVYTVTQRFGSRYFDKVEFIFRLFKNNENIRVVTDSDFGAEHRIFSFQKYGFGYPVIAGYPVLIKAGYPTSKEVFKKLDPDSMGSSYRISSFPLTRSGISGV